MSDEVVTRWGHEPFSRVYRDGRDVTDEDPATWPWPWSEYFRRGWRPGAEWDNRFRPSSSRVPKAGPV